MPKSQSGSGTGGLLCPCNKIVKMATGTGQSVELLPCGGGLVGMSLEAVQRYCEEWFETKRMCSGWKSLHGETAVTAVAVEAAIVEDEGVPYFSLARLAEAGMTGADGYRGVAWIPMVTPPTVGEDTSVQVVDSHSYPEVPGVPYSLLVRRPDGKMGWFPPEEVLVLCEKVGRHVYPDGRKAVCVKPGGREEMLWVVEEGLPPSPASVVISARETSGLGDIINQMVPIVGGEAPTFESLLGAITGGADPIILRKPDVGEILAGMQGLESGSSLRYGLSVHLLMDWIACRRRVYLSTVQGIRSRYPAPHFQIGSLYHAALFFAKKYGLDHAEEPLKYVEEVAGAGVLGEEMEITRAVLRARLSRFGHLDHGPASDVVSAEVVLDAMSEAVKVPGKTGSQYLRLCGRLDDVRRGLLDGKHEVFDVHDEKTTSMLTRELTEGFGLDFQLMAYGAIYMHGGHAGSPDLGALGSARVTIAVKPDVRTGGVRAVDPMRGIVRVESRYDRRDVESTWRAQMMPAAQSLMHALATWDRGPVAASGKKPAVVLPSVDEMWPKCTVSCVGRWGRCDYFDLCARHFDSVRGVEDHYEVLEKHQLHVLSPGSPYFEKVRGPSSSRGPAVTTSAPTDAAVGAAVAACTAANGAVPAVLDKDLAAQSQSALRPVKEMGAEVLGYQIFLALRTVHQSMFPGEWPKEDLSKALVGLTEPKAAPAWLSADPDGEALLRSLFSTSPMGSPGLDESAARRALTYLLKLALENMSAGSKEAPMQSLDVPGLRYMLLGRDSTSGRAKSPIVQYGEHGKWTAVPRNMIVEEMLRCLFSVEEEADSGTDVANKGG